MGVNVTIRPHVVGTTKFDQFQVLIGQRVVGYKAKQKGLPVKLVVRDLPEDALAAINEASAKMDGVEEPTHTSVVSHPIGAEPAQPAAPPADPADSAELESELEKHN